MASGNIEKINAWESRYRTTEPVERTEQNSKISLKAFLKSFDLNLDFNKVNTYDFTTI